MVRLEHIGACSVNYKDKYYLPGDIIEADKICAGLKELIARGILEIEGDGKASKQIAQEVKSKSKRKEPKTIDEAQTGQEYK